MAGNQSVRFISSRFALPGKLFHRAMSSVHNNYTTYTTTEQNVAESIDMRSDTVTQPTQAMKEAMMNCPLGDDVYTEDPTVNSLEKKCAALFQKPAALFVASGTMGNLISVMAHCQRGDEIIVGRSNHIHRWEQGNYAQLASVSATTLNVNDKGMMNLSEMEESIRVNDCHMPRTKLICLETTHNYSGGKPIPLEYLKDVRQLADKHHLKIHIDGARIYNAAVAMGVAVADIAAYADSVMMCFSKGLGAPIGSILVGSESFIADARRIRKALGGGWRQAGILASAASVALDNAMQTIERDHRLAKTLADAINNNTPENLKDSLFVDTTNITNMVVLQCKNRAKPVMIQDFFRQNNILVMAFDHYRVRIIPNSNVSENDIAKTVEAYRAFVESL
ncbi:unnamed protein product [Auanema sp. JU1783]|nr:unnamed protein product [Auanema sp. JU1783]